MWRCEEEEEAWEWCEEAWREEWRVDWAVSLSVSSTVGNGVLFPPPVGRDIFKDALPSSLIYNQSFQPTALVRWFATQRVLRTRADEERTH